MSTVNARPPDAPPTQPILFGGALPVTSQAIEVKDPSGNLKWWQVLEQAFFQVTATDQGKELYGDPQKGASIEQAWRTVVLISGIFQVCLLASGRPPVPTAAIPRTVLMTPEQLTDTLARLYAIRRPAAAQIFIHDGKMGHCVTLFDFDPAASRFLYHDSWPGRSLLCAENNAAGVDAQPTEDGQWTITTSELSTIIFACFLDPTLWADLTGVNYRIAYADLKQSEFWSFFHITEAARQADQEGEIAVLLRPGGFQQQIALQLELDASERVAGAMLALKRDWLIPPEQGANALALDIAKSFIATFTPPPDAGDSQPLSEAVWNARDPEKLKALFSSGLDSPAAQLLLVMSGQTQESTALMNFSRLTAENLDSNGEQWFRLSRMLY